MFLNDLRLWMFLLLKVFNCIYTGNGEVYGDFDTDDWNVPETAMYHIVQSWSYHQCRPCERAAKCQQMQVYSDAPCSR